MHNLNNSALIAQCARIKAMVEEVSRSPKHQEDYYARYHHWTLSPPAELWEIEEFEKIAGIELPDEYVYYLTQVGRGGACPGTFFRDFPEQNYVKESITRVSEKLSKVLSEKDWNALYGEEGHDNRWESGVICLCGMDLTYEAYLIVTGPNRGRVVYLDYDGEKAPMWHKGGADFLSWCEDFYSELSAGYNISPTWRFMWQQPGDENALISAFQNNMDKQYREEIIYSFLKFGELSGEARQFLEDIRESEFADVVQKVLQELERTD